MINRNLFLIQAVGKVCLFSAFSRVFSENENMQIFSPKCIRKAKTGLLLSITNSCLSVLSFTSEKIQY